MAASQEMNHAQLQFSYDSRRAFKISQNIAKLNNRNIGLAQLTLGTMAILGRYNVENILIQCGIQFEDLQNNLTALIESQDDSSKPEPNQQTDLTPHAKNAVTLSVDLAKDEGRTSIEPKHLFTGIVKYSQAQYNKQGSNELSMTSMK